MDRYTQVLQELIRNTCLEGASLVSADGLPIASVLKPGMEENRIAAMSAAILSLGERVSEELAKGRRPPKIPVYTGATFSFLRMTLSQLSLVKLCRREVITRAIRK